MHELHLQIPAVLRSPVAQQYCLQLLSGTRGLLSQHDATTNRLCRRTILWPIPATLCLDRKSIHDPVVNRLQNSAHRCV